MEVERSRCSSQIPDELNNLLESDANLILDKWKHLKGSHANYEITNI